MAQSRLCRADSGTVRGLATTNEGPRPRLIVHGGFSGDKAALFHRRSDVWLQQLEDAAEKLRQTTAFNTQAFQFENADWELWAPGGR